MRSKKEKETTLDEDDVVKKKEDVSCIKQRKERGWGVMCVMRKKVIHE